MECHFIGLFKEDVLCGIAVSQYIDLSRINTFGDEKKKRFSIKDYVFKKFSSHTLILGNNTLTGQNAYLLNDAVKEQEALVLFKKALKKLEKKYRKSCIYINLKAIKDFNKDELPNFKPAGFKRYYEFCTQPNMIFTIKGNWVTADDYLGELN